MTKLLGGQELLAAVDAREPRLAELRADMETASKLYGTDSPQHLAAIDAWEAYATAPLESYAAAPQEAAEPKPEPEPEAEI
jgi:hypothetical protein